jgi:hypothetical protein
MEYYAMIGSSLHMQTDVQSQRMEESPEIARFGDGHRCKKWNCPICHPGRSQQIMLPVIPDHVQAVPRRPHGHDDRAAPQLHVSFGDGGHKCKKFPCPVCQGR